MKWLKVLSVATLFALPLTSNAADIEAGKQKATTVCAACHGADGKTTLMPTYPKLAGQNAAYIALAINAYKNGERTGGQAAVMQGMAATLSDDDIANVAAYFSSLQ